MPARKWPCHHLEETSQAPGGGAANAPNDSVAGSSGISLVGVHFADGHENFRSTEKQVRQAAAKLASRTVIISGWILNISERGDTDCAEDGNDKQMFHGLSSDRIKQMGPLEINIGFIAPVGEDRCAFKPAPAASAGHCRRDAWSRSSIS